MEPVGHATNILSLVDLVLSLCGKIIKMAQNVKTNKERCQEVAQRVKAVEGLVLTIKQRGPSRIPTSVKNSLRELSTTLDSAKTLMEKFSQTNAFMRFVKSSSHEDKFWKVDKSLTDNFQVLSGALLIEQGNVLHKVYETVKGKTKTRTRPTVSSPSPSSTPTMTMCSPANATPFLSSMPTMAMCSLTNATPFLSSMPTMTMCSTANATPFLSSMPTMTMYNPTTPMPACCLMPGSRSSIALPGIMSSIPFSTAMAPNPAISVMAPMNFFPQNPSFVTSYSCSFSP